MFRRSLAVVGALALAIATPTAAFAATPDDDPSSRFQKSESEGPVDTTAAPLSVGADGEVTVIVEMKGDPVAVVQAKKGRDLTQDERNSVKGNLKKAQDAIAGAIKSQGGKIQADMQSAYNGIQLSIPAEHVDEVAALPNVVAVHAVKTYTVDNAVSVPFLGVPQVWQNTGYTGTNVKVAVIDTGIDYTHANFAGPGTVDAYQAALATDAQAPEPALFGPAAPRVKGGYDFVGDAYNANTPGSVPKPDENPLDCAGHGSHVAGTAAGSGVTDTGATYTGPYDSSTASKAWTIGPGVAPQADIYALRVFGCAGSTNVITPALDWAVDHGMNVINMSLGSPFSRGDDPDEVAASNAIGAGIVVVKSAGNSGPSPYIAGNGDGVISVSAVDSTATFPGAIVTVGGVGVPAINANGADLSSIGDTKVVRLTNNPATVENEALGCSVAAYQFAGVVPGGHQLAVAQRGTCARAAKAIFAQQAGAAVSLMVNNVDAYPPFEGAITSNPDTGEPYTVTIPFLGVKSTDDAKFVTDQPATVAAAPLANPGFRGYASFTSSGPRGGDSAVGVDVAAPGVSIVSTGFGTGNGTATMSGTSMASPHVAGVAALVVQAHPGWKASEVAAAIVSSADPENVAGQNLVLGGVGLVDAAQAVGAQVTATGDAFQTDSGWLRETALSYGFQESASSFRGEKTITLNNYGKKPVTYNLSSEPSAQSETAKIVFSPKKVTVPGGSTVKFTVTLTADPSAVGTSLGEDDQFSFYEFSGDVVLKSNSETLRVPYLLVPRATSQVGVASGSPLFAPGAVVADGQKDITLSNPQGALDAAADVYTWGLSDPQDVPTTLVDTGYDLRAAGVQSFDFGPTKLLVFAVNTHQRWSNAASDEFDVNIDTNGDGSPEYAVISADSGSVTAGSANGISEVFIYNYGTRGISRSGFFSTAPTDSSTILLPVRASALGLTATAAPFAYTVSGYSNVVAGASDSFDAWASYNPWSPALSNGQYETVPRNGNVTYPVAVNAAQVAAQKPLGVMTVVMDNTSGAEEAILTKVQ